MTTFENIRKQADLSFLNPDSDKQCKCGTAIPVENSCNAAKLQWSANSGRFMRRWCSALCHTNSHEYRVSAWL